MELSNFINAFVGFLPILIGGLLAVFSSAWAYHDARNRGKPPLLIAALVLLVAWPLGLVLWLIFRPDRQGPPPFNLQDFRVR